ncbi:MAG: PQQ-binding-like beta-propeller repeat protein [Treponema sp.]|jgi:outer membrane protein assembly factor BamB|nr:PQQ-binding-like beta-propeller repeat protein [Treponema sp.]
MKPKCPASLVWVFCIFSTLPLGAQTLGDPFWKQALGGSVIGLPSVQGGSVVVVCDGGNLKAYTRTGRFLWNYYARGRLRPFVTRSREGVSYIGRTTGALIAVSRTGRELWRANLGAPLIGPVLKGWDGRIFAATEKSVFCYTAAGILLWYKRLDQSIVIAPQADQQGGLILVLANANLLQIDGFGKTRSLSLPEVPRVIVPLGGINPESGNELHAIQIPLLILFKNGEIAGYGGDYPSFPMLPDQPIAAVSRDDQVGITLRNGQVLLLSLHEGNILWIEDSIPHDLEAARKSEESEEIEEIEENEESKEIETIAEPGVLEEALMLYDERGLCILSQTGAAGFTQAGQRIWFIRIIGASALPNFSDEGLLYSGGNDWILYAYHLKNQDRSQPQSVYGPLPEGKYGIGDFVPSRPSSYTQISEAGVRSTLAFITTALKEGRVGEREQEFTTYLMEVVSSVRSNFKSSLIHPPVDFRLRSEAVQLLAWLGSAETIPFLAAQFSREPEPVVQASIAEAIGRIGVDPEGLALKAFSRRILPPAQITDEQVLEAIAAAVGALCRFSGPPLSQAGIPLLVSLASYEKPLLVRKQALQQIFSLQ